MQPAKAQYGFQLDIKKPEPYDNRELKAEKTGDKKLKAPRRFMQNMTTHYNYFFNANNRLNEIIDQAKNIHKDDYSALLPFYNYSLNTTAQSADLLDSVIYKSKTGIVLHDLRNDWIDDMYLLWGAAHFLQKEFDSAYQMFQFINYAFAEKEKDGYYRYIGSRMDGNNATSIASKEDEGLLKRMISDPPARNNAFIWQARTMIEAGSYPEAGSLIATLKNDPQFPRRLYSALEEVQAYWFYKQGVWDSAALHLVKAFDQANNKQEQARWEYLAGQLFEAKGLHENAKSYYAKSIVHTTDPILEVFARLNLIRNNKGEDNGAIDRNIAELVRMAKRDKYSEYRDVIYSAAAQMELERGNVDAAHDLLVMASKFKTATTATGNKAYVQLADLAFARKKYQQAASFYDSVLIQGLSDEEANRIDQRKFILNRLVADLKIVARQDSLQKIAALPEEARKDYVKKLVRQLRRQQGLKEEESINGGARTTAMPDPFANQAKGEWYFYNSILKTAGSATFKQVWGNRPNVDNWRRFSDVTAQLRKNNLPDPARGTSPPVAGDANSPFGFDALYNKLPVSPELLQISNDSIRQSLLNAGAVYVNDLEDYAAAVEVFEELRQRFGKDALTATALYQLSYSYNKLGNAAKAAEAKQLLVSNFPGDRFATVVSTGKDPLSDKPAADVTKVYESIYDLFLEGKFGEASAAKAKADSQYKTNYWSPQLLYIQAVYHIKQRDDSSAKNALNSILQESGGTPIAARAQNLINVLNRRAQIEDELTKLQIERPKEDSLFVEPMPVAPAVKKQETVVITKTKDSLVTKPLDKKPLADTAQKKPVPVKASPTFIYKPDAAHYAVVILNKVDPVFVNEARNAFNRYTKEKFYSQPLDIKSVPLTGDIKLVTIGYFSNALGAVEYVQKTKPLAAAQIVPWLKADKFTFTIISEENLQALLGTKDLEQYRQFLDQNLPVKF